MTHTAQTQHYINLAGRYDDAQIKDIVALADMDSMRRRGYPVRSFKEIEQDAIPCEGDLSDFCDMLIAQAVLAYEAGERVSFLAGMNADEIFALMATILDEGRMAILRDTHSIQQAHVWFERMEFPPNG